MKILEYEIYRDFAELSLCHGRDERQAELIFSSLKGGELILDGYRVPMNRGVCRLPLTAIPDGVYSPVLITEGRRISVEGFLKQGSTISPLPTEDAVIRRLIERVRLCERTIATMQERIDELTRLCKGNELFN